MFLFLRCIGLLGRLEGICASPGLGITNPKWHRTAKKILFVTYLYKPHIFNISFQHYCSCVLVYVFLSGVGGGKVAGGTFLFCTNCLVNLIFFASFLYSTSDLELSDPLFQIFLKLLSILNSGSEKKGKDSTMTTITKTDLPLSLLASGKGT